MCERPHTVLAHVGEVHRLDGVDKMRTGHHPSSDRMSTGFGEITHCPDGSLSGSCLPGRSVLMSKTKARLSCAEIIVRVKGPWPIPTPTPIIRRRFVVATSAVARA